MKIVVQNLKTGKVFLADAPKPAVPDNGILVRTSASLISAGTDRAVVGLARKSTVLAISSGWPAWPRGICLIVSSRCSSGIDLLISVMINPSRRRLAIRWSARCWP